MDKLDMREWISALEGMIDNKLKKWKKESHIENGEAVQMEWQFDLTHILVDVFWMDNQESVNMLFHAPRTNHRYVWHGLNDETFNKVQDRVGHLAQITMYPPEHMR